MQLIVNASPLKSMAVATSNFAGANVTICRWYWKRDHVSLTQMSWSVENVFLAHLS